MKRRLLSLLLCFALLASILAVPGIVSAVADTITWQNGAKGQYAIVTETPDETPLNQGIKPKQGTSSTDFNANPNWGSSGTLANLTDGDLTNKSMIYFSQVGTTQYWESITFDLGAVKQVDCALVGSAESGPRNVYVKFYASTELATLYDASNLMAETKDGLSATELTVMLKGEAKDARYVGISTYLFNANLDSGKYPNIAGYGNQMRFSEIAFYEAAEEEGPESTPIGSYEVLTAVPTDTPLNVGKHIQQGTTGVNFNANGGNVSYLTDGNLDNYRLYYFSQVGSLSYWENITIDLGSSQNIDRLFVASQGTGERHVHMKFYASNDLATLYDATNLMAETKDGLGVDELNILMKGTAKEARYVGLSTYLPHASNEAAKYPSMAGFGNQFRFRELAVYAASTTPPPGPGPDPEAPKADKYGYYAADTGKYKALGFIPDDAPLNVDCKPYLGTSSTLFNSNKGNNARLADGSLDEVQMLYQSKENSTAYWEKLTFDLGSTQTVERLLVASEDAGRRHVAVKFYASTELKNLYDDANLVAAKDGFGVDELIVLLKGTAKDARYVGVATYIPDSTADGSKYPGLGARASQVRFRELAVYGVATGIEKDKDGFYAADTGKYKVTDTVPTDTPVNQGVHATQGTTATKYGNAGGDIALLTDGSLTTGLKKYYQKVDNSVGVWEYFTFALNGTYKVDSLFVGSEVASTRQVHVKFYASDKLETLYDETNLVAAKDGLTKDQLNVLLKGEVKEADYVGVATYVPDTKKDTQYKDLGARASQVRFTELAVYGTLVPELFTTTVITGSNYQTALPTGKNLLKGADVENKPADYLQMLKPTGIAWAEAANGGAEGVFNQANLTDGKMNGINTTDSNLGSLKNYAGTAFVYDLRGTVDISHLLVHASKEDNSVNYLVTTLEVYVSDELTTLLNEDKLVDVFTFTLDENVKLFATDTKVGTVKGRYIAFKPNYCKYAVARFGELGVYGTYESGPRDFDREIFTETVVTSDNYQTTLPAGDNLLLGKGIGNKPADYLQMLQPDGSPWSVSNGNNNGLTNYQNVIDGKMNGINTTESNVGSLRNFDKGAFVYDLRGIVDISHLLIHADKESGANYVVGTMEVYVSNKLDTLLTDDSYVQTLSFTVDKNVKVFAPKEELKGRYIGFKPQYCQYAIARFGELGVYGTYESGPNDFDMPIIQGKEPVDYYFAPMGDPGTRLSAFPAIDSDLGLDALTNGNPNDRVDFNLQNAIGEAGDGFEWGDGGSLLQGTPWVVLTYYLEGTVDVNTISLYSPAGSLATAGVEFYVSTLQADLYKSENRVHTTNGEKTYWDAEKEENFLDPAYDRSQTLHSVDLSDRGGVSGRYVGIVITRPYACDKQGWGFARLSEVEIGGARVDYDPVFTDDMHIWTDAATGITANLSRLNNDDLTFFQNISGMTVVKTAILSTMDRDVDDNWLAVDGDYTYTIQLKDKAGKVISDQEMGERYWKISFPNESGQFRMMGLLKDNVVTRLRHSYTSADDKTVLVGNDMKLPATMTTGNNLTFVYLKYNTLEYIEEQNGIGEAEFVPYITAGAAGATAPATTPWWLIGLAVLLLAGCVYTVMSARRVRQ